MVQVIDKKQAVAEPSLKWLRFKRSQWGLKYATTLEKGDF